MSVTETTAGALPDIKLVKEKFGNEEIEVIYRKARTPISPSEGESADISAFGFSPDLNQRTYIAEPGIMCEQDIPVTLRDGTIIYTDMFRPVGASNVPAIVTGATSASGSRRTIEWQAWACRRERCRGMAKFESADPAYWCHHGYRHRQSRSARRWPFAGRHQHVRHPGRP